MDTAAGPKLLQQAEKILLHPIHPHLISYCPTMDLIALVTDEENLDVYRINGQRAFGMKRKSEDETIDAVAWQGNGASVAVAWSGGSVDVVGCEMGKVVHRDVRLPKKTDSMEDDDDSGRIKCLGWGLNFIDVDSVKRRTGEASLAKEQARNDKAATLGLPKKKDASKGKTTTIDLNAPTIDDWDVFKDDTTLEDFLQRQPDFERLDIAPDLPDQLAMMDMETLLPKLPPIPLPPANPFMMMRGAQANAGAFSTQAEVDGLLHSYHLRDHNSVDMFIRCTAEGTVHPSIYDSMETVDIHLPSTWEGISSTPIMHASHPYACTHALLMSIRAPSPSKPRLAFVPLTLGFIPSAGIYLHLIASKTAQLQNLLSYLTHTLSRIRTFFTHSQDLPSKFMCNISETLAEHAEAPLIPTLYHLACTGHCPPLIHDWLVDELAEQGHKRWDNAVASNLATAIQLLHENFLPALDRCSIIISRLRGLAAFYEDQDWIFSGPLAEFAALLDALKTLRLLAHTALVSAADERRQFAAFSKWLRYEIDFEATEPESQSRAEMEARDAGVDIAVVLEYIQYGMTASDVAPFLKAAKDVQGETGPATKDGNAEAAYDEARKAIESLRAGALYAPHAICLESVLKTFGDGVQGLLRQVSAWQENNISMDCGLVLHEGEDENALDMRLVYEPSSPTPNSISTYIALRTPSAPSTLHIHRLHHAARLTALPTSLHAYAICVLSLPEHKIIDAKFTDDTTLLVLLESQDKPEKGEQKTCSLIALPYAYTNPPPPPASPPADAEATKTQDAPSTASSIFTPPYTLLHASSLQAHLLPHGTPPSTPTPTVLPSATLKQHTRHIFSPRFTPLRLVVNGRKGRRVVVVLGSDRKHYRVLDLDYRERKRADGEGEGEKEGETGDGKGNGEGEGEDSSGWEDESGSVSEGDGEGDVEMGGA